MCDTKFEPNNKSCLIFFRVLVKFIGFRLRKVAYEFKKKLGVIWTAE